MGYDLWLVVVGWKLVDGLVFVVFGVGLFVCGLGCIDWYLMFGLIG